MHYSLRRIACLCFILSGAASVSYQLIWLRDAMTYFGVITPVISSVLSVFMLGLAIGTLLFGRISRGLSPATAIIAYAVAEVAIAVLANFVPAAFNIGYDSLADVESQTSGAYLFASWAIITVVLLPVCTLIGATLPLIMRFLEAHSDDERNFGFLYFSNLVGAVIGCFAPLILIELLGFSASLLAVAACNVVVAILALSMLSRSKKQSVARTDDVVVTTAPPVIPLRYRFILFITGFVALGSEVVWIRAFTPAVTTTVYAFASILAIYLAGSFAGTWRYLNSKEPETLARRLNIMVWIMPAMALLPILGSSMLGLELKWASVLFIAPICFCLGFITPQIIDRCCHNHPGKTAIAYGYNFAGCILGPLFTTYLLFPVMGVKGSLALYALLLLPVAWLMLDQHRTLLRKGFAAFAAMLVLSWFVRGYEDDIKANGLLYRDHVGYIGATGEGMKRLLTVNGIGMTYLTTITKNMTHLPLTHHPEPRSALVICFGMGTTLRSLTRWPELEAIHAVELSEGVTKAMHYFHDDAGTVLNDPRVKVIVDDGRRYLNRTDERYDVITIDPPPPIRSAGSGLLYSEEFIGVVKSRLTDDGILAHWLPAGDELLTHAVLNAISRHFEHVVVLDSIEGWGLHILASDSPVAELDMQTYQERLPEPVRADIMEWHPDETLDAIAAKSLNRFELDKLMIAGKEDVYMSDDRLHNEFFRLRRLGMWMP